MSRGDKFPNILMVVFSPLGLVMERCPASSSFEASKSRQARLHSGKQAQTQRMRETLCGSLPVPCHPMQLKELRDPIKSHVLPPLAHAWKTGTPEPAQSSSLSDSVSHILKRKDSMWALRNILTRRFPLWALKFHVMKDFCSASLSISWSISSEREQATSGGSCGGENAGDA